MEMGVLNNIFTPYCFQLFYVMTLEGHISIRAKIALSYNVCHFITLTPMKKGGYYKFKVSMDMYVCM